MGPGNEAVALGYWNGVYLESLSIAAIALTADITHTHTHILHSTDSGCTMCKLALSFIKDFIASNSTAVSLTYCQGADPYNWSYNFKLFWRNIIFCSKSSNT